MKITFVPPLFLALAISACAEKANIIFGPDPVRQIGDSSEQFATMPESDRKILFLYVSANPQLVGGRRARDVLEEAKTWHATYLEEEHDTRRAGHAKLDLQLLSQAMRLYKLDNSRLPTQDQAFNAL